MLRELIPNSDQKRDKASFLLEVHTSFIVICSLTSFVHLQCANYWMVAFSESICRLLSTFSFYRRKYISMRGHTKDGAMNRQNWCHGYILFLSLNYFVWFGNIKTHEISYFLFMYLIIYFVCLCIILMDLVRWKFVLFLSMSILHTHDDHIFGELIVEFEPNHSLLN